ncbi:unnamed protein product [Acanthoscelides obtectus]|uniref:5-formyltetrahydrofolate cyclo-ligase n=1 Tax=Acanthoscelides obtectus TaxID=200917 RepID=A0A9P0K3S0_ACAOB|nr:unnamed protein product [Acanthoscelides obtectus]CAK1658170.1 5-formyltetrahydrofolate cyclo-ligase [Acanthoscelides obtectus]
MITRMVSTTVIKMVEVKTSKANLRNKMKQIIKDIPNPERQKQSKKVVEKLFNLKQYRNAKTISIFLSMKTEIDTEPVI